MNKASISCINSWYCAITCIFIAFSAQSNADLMPSISGKATPSKPEFSHLETTVTQKALANKITQDMPTSRGQRNCELFQLGVRDDALVVDVWNNAGQGHSCSDTWLDSIDTDQYIIDGPRWNPADYVFPLDAQLNFILDPSRIMGNAEPIIREIPSGSGVTMVLAATVEIMPIERFSEKVGRSIQTAQDIPYLAFRKLKERFISPKSAYSKINVSRKVSTFWVYQAGNPVYVLSDGQCDYAMKYFTASINDDLTHEDAIKQLNKEFEYLPKGYTYEVRYFEKDVYLLDVDGFSTSDIG